MPPLVIRTGFMVLAMAALLAPTEAQDAFTPEDRAWWAIQAVRDPAVPGDGSRHPIDAFVEARLAAANLARSPEAGPREFVRRTFFDLHGLPPTPAQLEDFVKAWNADRGAAVHDLIDDLLASPRYGERWAQHWLDVVRFAESDGYREDKFRPEAYRYRDYVIRAFNTDKPYDEFVREQLAADEFSPDDPERLVATGFLRHGLYEWNQRNAEMQREIIINEITNVTGEVFLGLGIGCAQCHDHKFDPLLQRDYYALQAFLSSTCWPDDRPLGTREEVTAFRAQQQAWSAATAGIRAEIDALTENERKKALAFRIESFPPAVQAMFRKPRAERSSYEHQIAMLVQRQVDREVRTKADPEKALKKDTAAWQRYQELNEELAEFDRLKPEPLPRAFLATDTGREAAKSIMISGSKKEDVAPAFPSLLGLPAPRITPRDGSTGRRTALAAWIASPENPFTARVIVNRIWQYHFGRGLVATPNDFGMLGDPPSHPELLDWLTSRFIAGGWKMKPLHELIMTSGTYRQTARREPGDAERLADHQNTLLWRFPPRRLSAEQVRDAMLAVSGEMKPRLGGPSVAGSSPHRSVYVKKLRNTPDPVLHGFDAPAGFDSTPARQMTTTPTQALLLTNNEWPLARARAMAKRLLGSRETLTDEDLEHAFRLAWGRDPSPDEMQAAADFLRTQAAELAREPAPPRPDKFPNESGLRPITQAFGKVDGIPLGAHALWLQPGSRFESLHVAGLAADPESFTVEAVVTLDAIHPDGRVNVLASQWNGAPTGKGWAFGVTSKQSRYEPRNLIVQLIGANPGGDIEYEVVASGLRVPLGRPVYLAAAIACRPNGRGTVRFTMQDLSMPDAAPQVAEIPHNLAGDLVGTGRRFLVGGRDDQGSHLWDGQVARLTLTAGALDAGQLLINATDPPPGPLADLRFDHANGKEPVPNSTWRRRPPPPQAPGSPMLGAVTDFCHALLSSNEFLYLH